MGAESELLIAVDVGNTNTVIGVYVGEELVRDFRLSTDVERTADEHTALLLPLFEQAGLDPAAATGVIISSVVPPSTRRSINCRDRPSGSRLSLWSRVSRPVCRSATRIR